MNVKCDLCANEATVHDTSRRNGVIIERHLCEACAAQAGFEMPSGGPIIDLLKQFMTQQDLEEPDAPPQEKKSGDGGAGATGASITVIIGAGGGVAAGSGAAPSSPGKSSICATCKTTFADFKQHGVLGCQDCYENFEGFLGPLLERAHDGGVSHSGKTPRRLLSGTRRSGEQPAAKSAGLSLEDRARRLRALHHQLEAAVKSEQYELAARVRDEIKRLVPQTAMFLGGGPSTPPAPSAGSKS